MAKKEIVAVRAHPDALGDSSVPPRSSRAAVKEFQGVYYAEPDAMARKHGARFSRLRRRCRRRGAHDAAMAW